MEETGITAPAPDTDVDMAEASTADIKQEAKQLEDLFDDEDSDEEFPSSAAVQSSSQFVPDLPTYGNLILLKMVTNDGTAISQP